MKAKPQRPVILSVYYRHKQGGFTKRLYRAYNAIAASGHQLIYVAAEALPVEDDNIYPVILPMRSKENSPLYWPEFYLRTLFKLRQLSKQHQVQTHFVFSCFYATASVLSNIGLPIKTITLVRGDDVFDAQYKPHAWLRGAVHKTLEKIAVRYSQRVLATSSSMQQAMRARNPEANNIGTLANDITTAELGIRLPRPGQTVHIATVSVLNERKNIMLALQALARLKHLDWEYRLIGPDTSGKDHAAQLKQYCADHGIADRVKFLGWQNPTAAAQLLQDCHLFIFPTLMEGSPNALMEAMGYGLPCLASRIPEVTEVLTAPELHFDPHDPAELAHKIAGFITQPDQARQMTKQTAGDKQRYQFDWDQHIVKLINSSQPLAANQPLHHVSTS